MFDYGSTLGVGILGVILLVIGLVDPLFVILGAFAICLAVFSGREKKRRAAEPTTGPSRNQR